ncbi:MAG: hypothetical protein IJS03_06195 [Eubacterium sp.]|nr:hypothetical protein [Eubacterium sp.]
MIYIIIFSIVFAVACLGVAVFSEAYVLLVFAVLSLIIFGITYSRYNKQKHPEEYKKTDNFNPNARIVANGSKAGTIITVCMLAILVILAVLYFILYI